ncbi:MAG TPA: acyl carrier protein [Rugosimonospora sp.]|nr:acyl carrier protein [Rugosimonospora sp.]
MQQFTVADLDRIVRASAGDDGPAIDESRLDVLFSDLGYDSLAMLETVSRVSREFGASLADDVASEAATPRQMLAAVNEAIASAAA